MPLVGLSLPIIIGFIIFFVVERRIEKEIVEKEKVITRYIYRKSHLEVNSALEEIARWKINPRVYHRLASCPWYDKFKIIWVEGKVYAISQHDTILIKIFPDLSKKEDKDFVAPMLH